MRLPRWVHFVRAWWGGYFWLRCTNCNRPFGGHEKGSVLETSASGGIATCAHPGCKRDVAVINGIMRRRRERLMASSEAPILNAELRLLLKQRRDDERMARVLGEPE